MSLKEKDRVNYSVYERAYGYSVPYTGTITAVESTYTVKPDGSDALVKIYPGQTITKVQGGGRRATRSKTRSKTRRVKRK